MSALHVGTDVVEPNTLGKYRLLVGLGRGGMATVHLAVVRGPAGFNKLVVIKQMYAQCSEDPDILGMFLDEARLAARLRHHNVVQTNEVGQEGERYFMVMEFLDGQPLNRILHRLGPSGDLPLAVHLRIIADMLEGLHYAHELADYDGAPLGVVHRDINPQNIFVTYDGVVKIVDFGIAKAQSSLVHTGIGMVKGKISYMAPEQIGGGTIDRRADVFAVGVMLWEAVTGTRPWKGVPDLTVLKRVTDGRFPSAREVRPDIPDALHAILCKALAHERDERYATAAELQADLEAYLESTGERTSMRDIGSLISAHFAADRAAIDAIVKDQLRRHDEAPSSVEVLIPTLEQPATVSDRCGPSPWAQHDPQDSSLPETKPSMLAVDRLPDGGWARRARRASVARVGALVAGAALMGALGWMLAKGPAEAEASSPRAGMAGGPTLSSTPSVVALHLAASPAEAQVFLDDKPLPQNPFEGMLARDRAPHSIRVEAKGFVSRTESVTLDQDQALDVALAPEPVAEADAVPVSPQPAPSATGHLRTRERRLDSKNPYARP